MSFSYSLKYSSLFSKSKLLCKICLFFIYERLKGVHKNEEILFNLIQIETHSDNDFNQLKLLKDINKVLKFLFEALKSFFFRTIE